MDYDLHIPASSSVSHSMQASHLQASLPATHHPFHQECELHDSNSGSIAHSLYNILTKPLISRIPLPAGHRPFDLEYDVEWLDKEEAAGASSRLKREHMVRQKKLLSRPLIKQFLERVGDMEKVQVRPDSVRGAAATAARAVLAMSASEQLGSHSSWNMQQKLQVGPDL